jgi:hypothetical protein
MIANEPSENPSLLRRNAVDRRGLERWLQAVSEFIFTDFVSDLPEGLVEPLTILTIGLPGGLANSANFWATSTKF